jgi:hypothetical protein
VEFLHARFRHGAPFCLEPNFVAAGRRSTFCSHAERAGRHQQHGARLQRSRVGQRAPGGGVRSSVLIMELEIGNKDHVEFMNVTGESINISNWRISVYDFSSWPEPLTR